MKKIISLVLITVLVLSASMLASCGGSSNEDLSDSKYVGKWKIGSIELQEESEDFDEDWVLEINGDGTGKSIAQGETDEFTWEPTKDGFKTKGDLKLTFTDDGDRIIADLFGARLVFEKLEDEGESEEAAEPTRFYGGYGYMGDDPAEGAVYEYMATEVAKEYEPGDDLVSIPVVCVVDKVENEDGTVDVYGEFEVFNYKVEGDTLETQSGGSHPGKMHLVPDGDYYKAESLEVVADGSDFDESAKKIFGDKYDDFMKVYSDDKAKDEARMQAIKDYVQATGSDITQYQDYGWDPVKL